MTTLGVTLPQRTASPAVREHRFFLAMAVAIALTVFAGFAPTYYLRGVFQSQPLAPIFHWHGLLFTAWVLLFVVQVSLISAHRTDLHRRVGVAGVGLAVLLVVVGYRAAMHAAIHGFSAPNLPPPLVFIAVPLFDLVVFSTLFAAAIACRRNPSAHKRLMLLTMISVLTPAIARLPGILALGPVAFFGLTDLFVLAGIVFDKRVRGRVHPAYLWGGLFLVISQPLRLVVAASDTWLAFATWLTR